MNHIGPYELHEILGSGGFGVVHRATHRVLQRDVALKLLFDQRDQAGFIREARILCALRHPNLVDVFDCGVDGDRAFLAMELVHGETLGALLSRGALSEAQTTWVLCELLAPLAVAHQRSIVHRDIKPSNILVAREGESTRQYLVDFGIASDKRDERTKATGPLIGTARYMAPEILRGVAASESSDLWAVGVVALECITGRVAYEGTAQEIFSQITAGPPPSLPSIPYSALGTVIRKLLAAVEARPKTCEEVLGMLDALPRTPPPLVAGGGSLLGLTQQSAMPLIATTAGPANSVAHRPAATRIDFAAPTRTPDRANGPSHPPSATLQSVPPPQGTAPHASASHATPPQETGPLTSAAALAGALPTPATQTLVQPTTQTVPQVTPVAPTLLGPQIVAKAPSEVAATESGGWKIGLFIGLVVLLAVFALVVVSVIRVRDAAEEALEEAIRPAELEPLGVITAPRQFHCEGAAASGHQERFERVLDDVWGSAPCSDAFIQWRVNGTIDSAAPTSFAHTLASHHERFPPVNEAVRCTCSEP